MVSLKLKKKTTGHKTRKQRLDTNFLNSVKHNSVGIYNKPFFQVDIKFWIFIPVYNFGKFLELCFESLDKQTFTNFRVLVIDDCSTDDSSKIIKSWSKKFSGFDVITNGVNRGPAYTKWQAITWTRERAAKNDIFTILDGDDYFSTKSALEIIANKYLTTKCWTTYGSADGKFSKRAFTLKQTDIDNMRGVERFNFQHPRTCLAFLLDYMVKTDFMDGSGKWLKRVTDRQFVYKLLELSGQANICHIKQILYKYREHDDNARNKVPNSYKREIVEYISKTEPAVLIEEKIHIVMCCYKRHENLKDIIEAVDKQSVANRIVFHIVNTNPEVEKWRFLKSLVGEDGLVNNIEIRICNTNENLFGYARFLYTKNLLSTEIIPYVIFIDDDQKLPKKWVENIYNTRAALSYNCWFGRIFDKFSDVSKMDYWKGVASSSKSWSLAKYESLSEFHYGGTGGSIIDTNIFRFDILFRCPLEYRNIEDLWLSFVVKQIVGGKINIFREKIPMQQFENESGTALWKTIGDRKSVFLRSLVNLGYLKGRGVFGNELEKFVEKKSDADKSISKFTYA
jgi:GT2 family glycosyltransferase